MNSQTSLLLAIGAFVALIVTVAAVDQYLLDKHPPTEVEGLMWRAENAFDHIQDLEVTLQVTTESLPADNLRMKVRYIKGPPALLSMRYLPPQDAAQDEFSSTVRDETFTVQSDQLFHYIPSEDIVVTKRWPGVPLVTIGLGIFDISQVRDDWVAGKTKVRILQDISGFTGLSFGTSVSVAESFSSGPDSVANAFSVPGLESPPPYSLCFSFCPEFTEGQPELSLGVAQALNAEAGNSIPGSYILEIRDASTDDLVRMIWIDRETYLIQKVVTFDHGQRDATLLVQLMTIDQGLTEADVVTPPEAGVENVRG